MKNKRGCGCFIGSSIEEISENRSLIFTNLFYSFIKRIKLLIIITKLKKSLFICMQLQTENFLKPKQIFNLSRINAVCQQFNRCKSC